MDDRQIQAIVDRVMREVGEQPPATRRERPAGSGYVTPPPAPDTAGGQRGIFSTLDEAVAAATAAFRRLNALPLAIREDMVAHMRRAGREHATLLAEMAHQETGMGRVAD